MDASRWVRVVAVVSALALAGCGGGEESTAPSVTGDPPRPTTSAAPTADPATTALAQAAVLTPNDLGGPWAVFRPETAAEALTEGDCGYDTQYAKLPLSARHVGPQLQRGDAKWYVSSTSAVFPDESGAKEWVETRKSGAYVECRRAALEKEQKDAGDQRLSMKTAETSGPGLGENGYEGYVRYQLHADTGDGPQPANGSFSRHTYRVGRTVISVSVDVVSSENDPPDLPDKVAEEVKKGLAAAFARVR
ncbi:hypothetical protein AB0A74_15680 [Saccharothrix sp. NPDC042600]|uniref:hypothetical protein n=1 Tax=Saccharothrix TaxID=2071 RepID=UPI0033D4BEA5|nr:hypothetical protein GCM10017745_44830 [Saccharothrix mutabilis subsp. capreolus]